MAFKRWNSLIFVLVLIILSGVSQISFSQEKQALTLTLALEKVFLANPSLAIFLKEQNLAGKKEGLAKYPTVKFSAIPGEIINGEWQKPQADVNATMPLADSLTLSGRLNLELDQGGVDLKPSGSLSLNYKLLGEGSLVKEKISPRESLLQYENSLVLTTFSLMSDLRQKLDAELLARKRLKLLEDYLEGAKLVPDYDDLKLKKDYREQKSGLLDLQEQITQSQLELAYFLGITESIFFDPDLQVHLTEVSLDETRYYEDFATANSSLQGAKTKLANAQNKLDYEKKTAGWNLDASGKVSLDQTWNLKLSASKDLYPRRIILEELELEVAKAEQELKSAEQSLDNQFKSILQGIKAAEKQLELHQEHLQDAQEDLELRERQYAADLVTEFQLREAQLELQSKKLAYKNAQLAWGKNVLKLWEQCGYNLLEEISRIIS